MAKFSIIILLTLLDAKHGVSGFKAPVSLQPHHKSIAKPITFCEQQSCLVRKNEYVGGRISMSSTTGNEEGAEAPLSNKLGLAGILASVYINYVKRLWRETAPEERKRIASRKASLAINNVKHLMEGEEYIDLIVMRDGESLDDFEGRVHARDNLLAACNSMLEYVDTNDVVPDEKEELSPESETSTPATTKKKKSRSVLFGAGMGAIVACWVFSGNYIFTALFTLMTALGQLEFYRMVMNTGIYPARKISVAGACAMFVTVCSDRFYFLMSLFF